VRIDWDNAETLAVTKIDGTMLPVAKVALTVRDRTWKTVAM
jgi:hypothetical protein